MTGKFPRLNVLISYAYLRQVAGFPALAEALPEVTNLMIDSGAFTNKKEIQQAAKLGKTAKMVSLEEYNNACRAYDGRAEYIQLDVIGDPVGTAANLQRSLDAGLRPIPVFTIGEDWGNLNGMVGVCDGRVCFGGIGGYGAAGVTRLAQRAFEVTAGKIRTHLLGYGMYPTMMALPIATCDSSSYTAGGKFGSILYFDAYRGILTGSWQDLGKPGPKAQRLMGVLRQYNIPISSMQDPTNYWKAYGIPALSATYSYLRMSEHVYRTTGKRYYLAAVNLPWFTPIVAVIATMTHNGFDYLQARAIKQELDARVRGGELQKMIYTCVELLREHTDWRKP